MFPSRERYKSSKDQLEKGRLMLEDVMKRLVAVPDWSHLGLICFTEIDSREIVRTALSLSQEEMKVMESFKLFQIFLLLVQHILTKEELSDPAASWLSDLSLPVAKTEDDSYKELASLLLGSLHVNFYSQAYRRQDRIHEDAHRVVGLRGLSGQNWQFPDSQVRLRDLKGKPLGDISTIMFYTAHQRELLHSLQERQSTVILGDYGTGKTVILQSVAQKLASQHDVHFISALGRRRNWVHLTSIDDKTSCT